MAAEAVGVSKGGLIVSGTAFTDNSGSASAAHDLLAGNAIIGAGDKALGRWRRIDQRLVLTSIVPARRPTIPRLADRPNIG
jgi:hypothetical protein